MSRCDISQYNSPPELVRLLSDMADRISALERTRTIATSSGAPTTSPPDGAQYGDVAGSFLYLRLGGTWKKVAVA